MRKVKKIFKYISYTLIFLLIAIGSAYGVITMSLNNAANKLNKQSGSAESSVPEEITSIVNNFMNSPAVEAEMQVDICMDDQDVKINVINAKVDLSNGIDNLVVDAKVSVDMLSFNNQITFDIQYKNGSIYIEGFNNKFKIETENLISSIGQIAQLLNIEMPSLGGLDMGALDVNALLGALKIADEVETESQTILNIEVPAINGNLTVVCDKDFRLESINVDKLNFNGIKLSIDGSFIYPNEVVIEEIEQEDYVNLSSILNYSENFNILTQKSLGFDFELNVLNQNLNGEIMLNLDSLNFMIQANLDSLQSRIMMIDEVLYVEFGNLYAKFNLEDATKLQPIFDRFNIALPLQNITELIGEFKQNGIKSLLGLIKDSSFDLENLDLSILNDVTSQNNELAIELNNIGTVTLFSNENGLSKVVFNSKKLALTLSVKDVHEFGLSSATENYVDLSSFIPFADNLTNLIKNKFVEGSLLARYKGFEITANYKLIIDDEIYAELDCYALGRNIQIVLKDSQIFVAFSNTYIKLNLNNLTQVLSDISQYFGLDLSLISTNLSNLISKAMNVQTQPLLIKALIQNDGGVEITLYNNSKIKLSSNPTKVNFELKDTSLLLQGFAKNAQDITVKNINASDYTNFEKLLPVIGNTYNYLKNGKYYVRYSAKTNDLTINGGINFEENNLFLICNINYKGLIGMIGLSEGKIYISFKDIRLSFDLDQFDKIETLLNQVGIDLNALNSTLMQKLGINLNQILDLAKGETSSLASLLTGKDVSSKIESLLNKIEISLSANNLDLTYDSKINAKINFNNEKIDEINVDYNDLKASITILDNPYTYVLNKKYMDCGKLVDLANNLVKYFKDGRIEISAKLNSSEGKLLSASLQADYSNKLKLGMQINSNIKENVDALVNIEDDMTYLNVNGLLFKLNNSCLKDILGIACELFDIDTSKISLLNNFKSGLDLTEIKSYLPTLGTEEIVNFINMIKSFEKQSNNYVLKIDASTILKNDKANNIIVTIITNGLNITGIKLDNVYTSSNLNEKYDVEVKLNNLLTFKDFDKTLSYIDVSDSSELLKALVNMTQAKTFNIKGSVDLQGDLIGIKINKNIGFDIKINVTANRQIEVYGILGAIPTLVGVNNDVPYVAGDTNSGSDRYLQFYYQNGYVYLYRSEKIDIFFGAGKRTYEKCVKVSLKTLLNDPLKYMQYGLGLTDKIMNEIKSSADKANNRSNPIDYSKIIKEFKSSDSSYTLKLNMAEILNNSDIDTLTITLNTSNDANNKKFISDASFTLSLPLSKLFKMKLSSSDIKLVGYNTELDMSNYYSYISNYKYAEGEFWEASKGAWNMVKETVSKLTFVTNSHQVVDPIEAKAGKEITLPKLNSYSTRSGDYRTYYTFEGWYFDATFKTKFTGSTMPGADYTLYAKWNKRVEKIYNYEDLII